MPGRSSAFLLTGLCTVVAIGLAGSDTELCHQSGRRTTADADAAGQRHDAGADRREPCEQACGVGERAWRHVRRHDQRRRDLEVRCRARCRVAAVPRRRGRERQGRVSALDRQRAPIPGSTRRPTVARRGRCSSRTRIRPHSSTASPSGRPQRGFAQSDSVNGQFPVVRTTNGQTWREHRRQRACGASRRVVLRLERHLCRHGGQEQRVGRHRGRIPVQGPRHAATAVTHGTPTTHRSAARRARAHSASPSGTRSTGWSAAEISIQRPRRSIRPRPRATAARPGRSPHSSPTSEPSSGSATRPTPARPGRKGGRSSSPARRRGVDTRRGRLLVHPARCDRLLGSRVRKPADRLAGRDRRPNPAGRF